jgi:hypothetical protein
MMITPRNDRLYIDRVARYIANGGSLSSSIREGLARVLSGMVDRLAPAAEVGGEIRLSSVTRDRIAGRLTLGRAGLLFDSQVVGRRLPRATIRTLDRRELVDLRADAEALTVRFGSGVAISRSTRTDIATPGAGRLGEPPGPAPSSIGAIRGDRRFLDEFFRSREFALLPELSYALGLAGATGHRYRPSLALHSLGLSAAGFLGVDPARPGVTYRWRLPRGQSSYWVRADMRALFDWFAPTDCWPGPDAGPNRDGLPLCPGGGCESYPNRDQDCFGMCGPGCGDCWSWVCGDCCFHDFCAEHDSLWRRCAGEADVMNCLASVLILEARFLGCDHGWLDFF